jgi:hypothetical protein
MIRLFEEGIILNLRNFAVGKNKPKVFEQFNSDHITLTLPSVYVKAFFWRNLHGFKHTEIIRSYRGEPGSPFIPK